MLFTNRRKAVIGVNCYALGQFVYMSLVKHSVNQLKVNALDICLVRTLFMLVFSTILAKCFLGISLHVPVEDRSILAWRSLFGTIGFTCQAVGTPMIPLVVLQTINGTSPFWAGVLGWCFLRESISRFEICAMVLSFVGICIIASSKAITSTAGDVVMDDEGDSLVMILVGSSLIFVNAWMFASVAIVTRQMQKLHFTVNLFYYSILATVVVLIILVAESLAKWEPIRLWSYSWQQWLFMCSACLANYIGMNCLTIAMQNERSGFISLLGYIGVVYAFLGDIFIFKEQFNLLQLSAICLVLTLNICLICKKQM